MATSAKPSFDDIIQQGRKKAKNEKLAERIFRRSSTPQSASRASSSSQSASLASRVGVSKRPQNSRSSSSQASLRQSQSSSRRPNTTTRKSEQFKSAVNEEHGISIKGMGSGSCIVVAQNFAPGTTAFDVEAVLAPPSEQSISSCRLIASNPTVIAELVFLSKDLALSVVERFNNKVADGRRLHVYIQKATALTPQPALTAKAAEPQPIPVVEDTRTAHDELQEAAPAAYAEVVMDVDDERDRQNGNGNGSGNNHRNQQASAPTQPRRAAPSYEDGRYGFGDDTYRAEARNGRQDNGNNYRNHDRRYDDRRYDDRGYQGGRSNGYNSQYRGYRQDYGGRGGGQGRLASDSMSGRR